MDSSDMSGISCDQELAANGIRGFAVKAFPGFFTRSFDVKPLGVDRCSHISGTFHGTVKISTHFIHSDNKDDFFGTLCNAGYAVGVAVNIDHNSIVGNRIGT